ncbi:hypothetical protein EMCRGX_G013080 [Ephydatia muelleri]|eukprot:Em0004g714a
MNDTELPSYGELRFQDGIECAKRATQHDQMGQLSVAITFYREAVQALNDAASMDSQYASLRDKCHEYNRRAAELQQYLNSGGVPRPQPQAPNPASSERDKRCMRQIEYLLELALLDDEEGRKGQAEKTYTSAVELAIKAQKVLASDSDKSRVKTITHMAIERLEQLKATPLSDELLSDLPPAPSHDPELPDPPSHDPNKGGGARSKPNPRASKPITPLLSFLEADSDLSKPYEFNTLKTPGGPPTGKGTLRPPQVAGGGGGGGGGKKPSKAAFTDAELKILRATSRINGVEYLPWQEMDKLELSIVNSLGTEFCDTDGLPPLSKKQKSVFVAWLRPQEIHEQPRMAYLISSLTIKQTVVGDCSFLASLAVSADYERKFKNRLITKCIYPQNRHGDPIMNPSGKYYVTFHLNGCKRKVVIDDRLPTGPNRQLLCSYSSNSDEFWISLIEKAYIKVMGGYDFPGSSSNIDLHALTGWIPERIGLKEADKELTHRKIMAAVDKGNALVTVATGVLSEDDAERAGLVPTHAYAVLKMVDTEGLKLLQLKNPWSHRRWKGKFSAEDTTNWTPKLKRQLSYDQSQDQEVDNGVFWIDLNSLCAFFDVLYVNWRPAMFKHKWKVHGVWAPGEVEKDVYNISTNPQYTLKVQNMDQPATVWILLSRHITTKSDFANNEKFITIHVSNKTGGRKVYFPEQFFVQGIKINTPHYLAKLENLPKGGSSYTVIVSQLESLSTIYFTLSVYSTCEFQCGPVPDPYAHSKQLQSKWLPGQSPPNFLLVTSSFRSQVLVKVQAPKEIYVHIKLIPSTQTPDFRGADSGPARPGFTYLEAADVPKGSFTVTATTYKEVAGKAAPFFITLASDSVFNFDAIP